MENLEANSIRTPLYHNIKEEPTYISNNENLYAEHDQKRVDKFYFASKDTTFISEIGQAKKIIQSVDQKQAGLYKKIKERKFDRDSVSLRLKCLLDKDRLIKNDVAWQKEKLEPLELVVDELSFANNTYKEKAKCLLED
ncbi:conserved hypothetical protein [Ricinus communis]|uniref:Uncharacterized protein n=1 Tax=Ricinus communis TaxID=3988 RepID=B9SQD8_RICCO|nr:conserved hypothetical protein [Ricinus communis]